jgi:hypothetical protein
MGPHAAMELTNSPATTAAAPEFWSAVPTPRATNTAAAMPTVIHASGLIADDPLNGGVLLEAEKHWRIGRLVEVPLGAETGRLYFLDRYEHSFTFGEPLMKRSPEERQRLLVRLDGMQRLVVAFYRGLLVLIMAAIIAAAGFVAILAPWGEGHQGEWFYFSIAVLLGLGWAVGQFIKLGRRHRKHQAPMELRSSGSGTPRVWEFRFGSEADAAADTAKASFSRSFGVPLASLSADVLPDESALDRLEAELAKGVELDDACRRVHPEYARWGRLQQKAYRMYVTARLADRGLGERDPASLSEE